MKYKRLILHSLTYSNFKNVNVSHVADTPQGGVIANGITIKSYFEKVRELHKSGDKYPVCLDEVWPLVYSRRDKAVKTLLENYIENEDFNLASPKGGASWGGANKKMYYLSMGCFEHFIARKVKEVFEVYRQIFHRAADQIEKPMSMIDMIIQSALMHKEQDAKLLAMDNRLNAVESKVVTHPDSYTVMGYAITHKIKGLGLQMAARIGAWAKAKCKRDGIKVESTPDPRFGRVCVFPAFILEEAFNTLYF